MARPLTLHEQVVAFIAAAYPVPSWEPETLRLYAQLVADIDAAVLEKAAASWVRTNPERPTVADLRSAARVVKRRAVLDAKRKARAAIEHDELEPADPREVRQFLRDLTDRLSQRRLPAPTAVDVPAEAQTVTDLGTVRQREQRKRLLLEQAKVVR